MCATPWPDALPNRRPWCICTNWHRVKTSASVHLLPRFCWKTKVLLQVIAVYFDNLFYYRFMTRSLFGEQYLFSNPHILISDEFSYFSHYMCKVWGTRNVPLRNYRPKCGELLPKVVTTKIVCVLVNGWILNDFMPIKWEPIELCNSNFGMWLF